MGVTANFKNKMYYIYRHDQGFICVDLLISVFTCVLLNICLTVPFPVIDCPKVGARPKFCKKNLLFLFFLSELESFKLSKLYFENLLLLV